MPYRVEVWSEWECNGGARIVPSLFPLLDGTLPARIDGAAQLTLTVPRRGEGVGELVARRVLRVVSRFDGTVSEWRIAEIEDNGGRVTVRANPPFFDLTDAGFIRQLSGGQQLYAFAATGSALALLTTHFLPTRAADGLSWVDLGTIATTESMVVSVNDTTYAGFVQAIAGELEAAREFRLRRNGATNYLLDMVADLGAGTASPLVRPGRNLILPLERVRGSARRATVIKASGATPSGATRPASVAFAAWRVAGIASLVVTLEDRNGGAGPIYADGAHVGKAVLTKAGTLRAITASSASAQTVTLAAVTDLAVDDDIEIRNADGTPFDELALPGASRVVRSVSLPALRGERNIARNPRFDVWTGTPPTGWTAQGDTSGALVFEKVAAGAFTSFPAAGAVAVNPSGGTSIQCKSLPASLVIPRGARVVLGVNGYFTTAAATTSGTGTVTLTLDVVIMPSFAVDTALSVQWGTSPGPLVLGTFAPWMPRQQLNPTDILSASQSRGLRSPAYTVRYIAGLATVRLRVWGVLYSRDALTFDSAAQYGPGVQLLNDTTSAKLAAVRFEGDVAAGAAVRFELAVSATLSADTAISCVLTPPGSTAVDPAVQVAWGGVMAHVGDDTAPPFAWPSHGTPLAQAAAARFNDAGDDVARYRARLVDLEREPGYVAAEERIALGATLMLREPSLGVVASPRVVSADRSLTDARALECELDASPADLAALVASLSALRS